uniref:Uncharacterized protein n=1 Tax=Strombidium rassoulzadegani TaxID=1082188 RepID=A0A7S3CI71_9SPIT|mmetsp:Transcript_11376/g.19179  ORF Transcript_11376/g.19179 Transcript_11376/m.19179 type:complete len:216 (+) Transcript_11376:29-676(+)
MLNLFSIRTNYWKNGTQFIGRIPARIMGEHNYEFFRIEKRIMYATYYYTKQSALTRMSREFPDVVNAFGVLAKEDTSHGFPTARPFERNSDWALYNINSEGWFQCYSFIAGVCVVLFWFYISDSHFFLGYACPDDLDYLKLKDSKAGTIWERVFWAFTYQVHGQHMSSLQRHIKFYVHHPEDPKLNVKSSYNNKNPRAPDRYYRGWGKMRDMRLM